MRSNLRFRVKEEFQETCSSFSGTSSSSSSSRPVFPPQPLEGLHEMGPPPFLTKTYEIVDDQATNHIISWSGGNNSLVVWDPQAFSMILLPKYFKHNNFSSFVRQLNTYGFRKVDPDRWEFANEGFLRGQKHLLKNIRRRKTLQAHVSPQSLEACVEVGRFGFHGEVDRLKRDKQVLMVELVKLRQQQQNTRVYLQAIEDRLKKTETKQQQMMNFLARAMQNPNFVQQLVQQKDRRKEFEEALTKKRRRPIDQGPISLEDAELDKSVGIEDYVKIEPQNYGDISELQDLELDELSMDMQGLRGNLEISGGEDQNFDLEKGEERESKKEPDEVFWEDLLNDGTEDEFGVLGVDDGGGGGEDDVDVLVEQLGYLAPSPWRSY